MFRNCVFRADVNTIRWLKAAVRRAFKTMAQTAVAMLPAAATIASILTSLAGLPELDEASTTGTKPQAASK